MLRCSWMLLLQSVLAAASLRGHEEKEGGGSESAPRLSSPVGRLRCVWRYCSEAPHHHARGRGMEWKIFFFACLLLWVCGRLRRTCRHDGRSVWLPLCSLERYAATLSLVSCFGDNVPAAVRLPGGGKCVSAAVKGRAGRLAAERIALPTQHRSCRAPSITLQHRSRRHQHAARLRMPPLTRVRPEGNTSAVAFRGGHTVWHSGVPTTSSRSPHTTPGTGRGVFASWSTLRLSPSSFRRTDA
ncbi:trans-sialidase [Trypanosoma cruzi]|nr:trans-sialidase [Trypanosoma cruzi]